MEAVKKYLLKGIFISILTIFAMSHNAFAIESLSNNVDIVAVFNTQINVITWSCGTNPTCPQGFGGGNTWLRNINGYGGDAVQAFYLNIPARNYYKGEIITIDLYFFLNNVQANHAALTSATTTTTGFHISTVEFQQLSDDSAKATFFIHVLADTDKTSGNNIRVSSPTGGSVLVLNSSSNSSEPSNIRAGAVTVWSVVQGTDYSQALNEIKQEIQNSNDDVEEKTQEAVEDSQDAGNSSASDAASGTTGLLNAITSAVSVISSASPTNCKINGNMGNLNMGQLDLCANPAPVFIQTIGSLILILICVPLAISLFNRFIALFRSFQN